MIVLGVWLAAFWTLVIVKPLAALCLWLVTLLYVLVVRRLAER